MSITRVQFLLILPAVLLFLSPCYAQIPADSAHVNDTTQYQFPDTLSKTAAIGLRTLGSLDHSIPAQIRDSSIDFVNYRYASDLLVLHPGFFVREFGGLGHIPDIMLYGNYPQQIQYANDGIRLNDPWSGNYNLFLYPAENIQQIEIIDGTRAFLYGHNSNGGVINFVSKSRRAIRPYSRLRYSESGYGFSIIDGMLSQNISRNLNVTAGIQHTVFGERYTNENFDGWNGRLKIRYDIDNTLSLFLTEIHNKTNLGLPGGVDRFMTSDSLRFDNLQAVVRNSDAYEKTTRNDFQIGVAAHPVADSTAVNTLTFYLSSNLREYRDEENRYPSNGIFIRQNQRTQWMGVSLSSNFLLGPQRITLGGDLQSQRILITPSTREERARILSAFGKTEIPILRKIFFSPYGRIDSYLGEHPLAYGCDLHFTPGDKFDIFAGYSRSFRFATFRERHGLDTIITSSLVDGKPERHHLLESGLKWSQSDWLSINLRAFYRITWNPIVLSTDTIRPENPVYTFDRHSKRTTRGLTGGVSIRIGVLYLQSTAQYIKERDEEQSEQTFPAWNVQGGIYYWDRLFRNNLEIKAGIQVGAFSSYISSGFNEQAVLFYPGSEKFHINSTSIFDLVILAHIGDAYFHIIMDNMLNTRLIMNDFYPLHERRLRFGVSWEFLD